MVYDDESASCSMVCCKLLLLFFFSVTNLESMHSKIISSDFDPALSLRSLLITIGVCSVATVIKKSGANSFRAPAFLSNHHSGSPIGLFLLNVPPVRIHRAPDLGSRSSHKTLKASTFDSASSHPKHTGTMPAYTHKNIRGNKQPISSVLVYEAKAYTRGSQSCSLARFALERH
jgi:hypothetical protein